MKKSTTIPTAMIKKTARLDKALNDTAMQTNFLNQYCIFRDDDILIIDKPAGLLSVPGKGEALFDSLLTRLQQLEPRTLLIHRLDRDTSGVMVFALNKAAQRDISIQFQQRQTQKLYTAIVQGHLGDGSAARGEIDVPVRYDDTRPPLHIADPDYHKQALTYFQVLSQESLNQYPVTRVALEPFTGRAHQLRVHMQYLGHPIVGDTLYADEVGQTLTTRLCLHATRLQFVHPTSKKSVEFVAPVPF